MAKIDGYELSRDIIPITNLHSWSNAWCYF